MATLFLLSTFSPQGAGLFTRQSTRMTTKCRDLTLLVLAMTTIAIPASAQGLKDHAPDGFHIGGVLHGDDESFKNRNYRAVAVEHFNAVTSSIFMPWGVWKRPGQTPNFNDFVAVVDWAQKNDMKVHGHVLVYPWANAQSSWWQALPNDQVEELLFRYVNGLAKTKSGQIWCWDVVNEVIAADGDAMDEDGLKTEYKEYQAMGATYIEKAFRWAAEADPDAILIFNSTGCETINSKSDRLFNYMKKLKDKGVPVHAVGFQCHFLELPADRPDVDSMRRNFQRFADAGFQIFITEMDVCSIYTKDPHPRNPGLSTPDQGQQDRQSVFFQEILGLALQQPACKGLFLWDYADDYSWLHKTTSQIHTVPPETYTYPTPFWGGRTMAPVAKPAVDGMLKVMQAADRDKR